jgi:hypothetical protein
VFTTDNNPLLATTNRWRQRSDNPQVSKWAAGPPAGRSMPAEGQKPAPRETDSTQIPNHRSTAPARNGGPCPAHQLGSPGTHFQLRCLPKPTATAELPGLAAATNRPRLNHHTLPGRLLLHLHLRWLQRCPKRGCESEATRTCPQPISRHSRNMNPIAAKATLGHHTCRPDFLNRSFERFSSAISYSRQLRMGRRRTPTNPK